MIKLEAQKFAGFLVKTQNTILSAAFVIALSTAANAVLGFAKGRLLVHFFGVSNDLTVFYTADRIPNLIYSVLIVGAISTIFIPIFTEQLKKNKEKAFKTASSIVNITILIFTAISVIILIYATSIAKTLSLGKFTENEIILTVNLMRIMIVSQLLLVVGSLVSSILQSFKYFLIPALAPLAYNIGMIGGIIFLSGKFGIYGPAYGVFIGSFLHMAIQLPLLKKTTFNFSFALDLKDKGLREMTKLVPPRLISVFLANMIGTINNSLAILVSNSSVVYLKFASQLQTFPVTLFGLSIAAASLPTLSMESDKENTDNFKKTFLTSLHQTMFLVIPVSLILVILRIPVVRIVYGSANFPWEATLKTAYVLAFFSLSVFAQSANYLITRAFFALKDTKTPVLISSITIIINVVLSVLMVNTLKLGVWAVALSFSITSILDSLLFLFFLNKKVDGFDKKALIQPFVKISYAALFMGITLYVPLKLLDQTILDTSRTINLLILCGIVGVLGMITYLAFTKLFKVEEIELLYKLLRKLNITRKPVNMQESENSASIF